MTGRNSMPRGHVARTAAALLAAASLAAAQEHGNANESLEQRIERLTQENRELQRKLDAIERRLDGATPTSRQDAASLDRELRELGAPDSASQRDDVRSTQRLGAEGQKLADAELSQAFGGVWTKPFLTRAGGATLGGYASWIYKDAANENRSLDFPRLIPFIYAQVSEHVEFATEIEIEDGHEVEVEFAFVDLRLTDAFNLRGGALLDPLGHFNLVHDDPVNELTERPLVDTTVIPTTLREVGGGAFGTLVGADRRIGQLSYELYFTSGFKGLFNDGTVGFNTDTGLSDGRAHEPIDGTEPFSDHNNNVAQVGRVEWSPALGAALGVSAHHGAYDQRGDNSLLITAVDGALDGKAIARWCGAKEPVARTLGGFEMLGEWARANIERDAFARASNVPGNMDGWYGQLDWRWYPDFLSDVERRGFADAGSHFTFVTRFDAIDLDGSARNRWTFGVNFRPNRYQTVLKFDYQLNEELGDTRDASNDAFLVSIATYF